MKKITYLITCMALFSCFSLHAAGDTTFVFADFNAANTFATTGSDKEDEGGNSSSSVSFDSTDTGKTLKWEWLLDDGSLGYSYTYINLYIGAAQTASNMDILMFNTLTVKVKAEGPAVGQKMEIQLKSTDAPRINIATTALTEGWNNIKIAIARDSLNMLAFVFSSGDGIVGPAVVYIDDIELSYVAENPGLGDVSNSFFDTFDATQIDGTKWTVADRKWSTDNGGVVPENVSLKNGNLVIKAHGNLYTGSVQGHDQNTKVGGAIHTKNKMGPGIYEVRAKIVPKVGALSGFWTYDYGVGGNTGYSEIDFEMIGSELDYIFCTNYETETLSQVQKIFVGNQTDGNYHTYRFEWYPASISEKPHIDYYYDDKLIAIGTNFIPNFDASFWIGVWFPASWAGVANFDIDSMLVDWVKITPVTSDPGMPILNENDSVLTYANFNTEPLTVYSGSDSEEGGNSTTETTFENSIATGKVLKWSWQLNANEIGYQYAYSLVHYNALEAQQDLDISGFNYLKFWIRPTGGAIGKTINVELKYKSNKTIIKTPVLNRNWNELEFYINTDSLSAIAFVFVGDTGTSGTVYIDDIKFTGKSMLDGGSTPPDGNIDIIEDTTTRINTSEQMHSLKLRSNPFKNEAVFELQLNNSENVSLKIFNLQGRLVENIIQPKLLSGTHTLKWNAGNAKPGIYFYQLAGTTFFKTGKMILMK